jgi:outer membrane receptor protein involved in Fe transport
MAGLLNLGTFEHSFDESRIEDQWTPSINIQYDISESTMLYASTASGFKGGGFDARILVDSVEKFEFKDEEALSIELGSKMSLMDGAGEMNIALFYTEIDDLQVSVFDGYTGFSVGNAAQMRSQGLEIDSRWRVTASLDISFSFAWLYSNFTDFKNAGCTDAQFDAWEAANPGKRSECIQDMSGERTFLSPEFQGNLSLLHTRTLGNHFLLRSGADLNYSDDFFLGPDNDPNLRQSAYILINVRIALADQNGNWEIALLGKNITDETISFHGSDVPLSSGSFYQQVSPPRSMSVQGIWRF